MTEPQVSEATIPFWKNLKYQVITGVVLTALSLVNETWRDFLKEAIFNKDPKAYFELSGKNDFAVLNEHTSFDASQSYDPEQKPLTYQWALVLDDQRIKIGKENDVILNHRFTQSGIVRIELKVTDNKDNSHKYTRTFEVKETPKSSPPKANLEIITSIDHRKVNNNILFSAIGSSDHLHSTLEYQWAVRGILETGFEKDNLFSHTFKLSDEYYVTLKVRNDSGLVGEAITSIFIKDEEPLLGDNNTSSNNVNDKTEYKAKILEHPDRSVVLNSKVSFAAKKVKNKEISYQWQITNEHIELIEKAGESFDYTIRYPGTYNVDLTLFDGDKEVHSTSFSFYVDEVDYNFQTLTPQAVAIPRYGSIDKELIAYYSKHPLDRKADLRLREKYRSGDVMYHLQYGEEFKILGIETPFSSLFGTPYYYLKIQPLGGSGSIGYNNFALGSMQLMTDCSNNTQSSAVVNKASNSYEFKLNNEGTCQSWQNTGITLRKGTPYRITAKGVMTLGEKAKNAKPVGIATTNWSNNYSYLLDGKKYANVGLLVGRLGKNGEIFKIGDCASFEPESDAVLYVNLNDIHMSNNKGSFTLSVETGYENAGCSN